MLPKSHFSNSKEQGGVLKSAVLRYAFIAKLFYWLLSALIVIQTVLAFFWDTNNTSPIHATIINWHRCLGLVVLLVNALALAWALYGRAKYKIPINMIAALFYAFLFVIPLTGWLATTVANQPPIILGHALPMPGIAMLTAAKAAGLLEMHGVVSGIFIALAILNILTTVKNGRY